MIDAYSILWRPAGTTSWIGAEGIFGTRRRPPATQTTITGLTYGTEYEFAVIANAADGASSPHGFDYGHAVRPGYGNNPQSFQPYRSDTAMVLSLRKISTAVVYSLWMVIHSQKVFNYVAPGSYEVTENDPRDWAMS